MAANTPRMTQLEALLADAPNDWELRYFLAMEHAGQGDDEEAARRLLEVTADSQPPYVPAFLQGGILLQRLGRDAEAVDVLRRGIVAAQRCGNLHAAGEMQGLLATLE